MSQTLRATHLNMTRNGMFLNNDSKISEEHLNKALNCVVEYATERFKEIGVEIEHRTNMSLFECQQFFHKKGGPVPNEANKKVYMKPDGGILLGSVNGNIFPILVIEDKVQGTNDSLYAEGKKKQSCGNAIERAGKNIRGCSMLFAGLPYFSYALFASGCDFHKTETIGKRIEMMNFGVPNHYIEIDGNDYSLKEVISSIKVEKLLNNDIFSCFIKANKWDKMPHNSSLWKIDERIDICKKMIDLVYNKFIDYSLHT